MEEKEKSNQSSANINTELAKERSRGAAERTLMAWMRTALALIGFGIGVYEVADKTGGSGTFRNSKVVGLGLIILGIFSVIFAIRENKISHKKLAEPVFEYENRMPLGIYIGYGLIIIAVYSAINIIYKFLV
jgi:putative membrane protein